MNKLKIIYVWIFENSVDFGPKLFCLPAGDSRQAGPCGALKVRGGSVMEGSGRKLRCLATSWYQGKGPAIILWGVGWSQREAFCLGKLLIFFAGQPLSVMPCRLSGWKPASKSQASWVSRVCVVRLPVADLLKNTL